MKEKKQAFWIALILGGASAMGAAFVIPYILALFPHDPVPLPVPVLMLISGVQTGVLLTALAYAGALWGPRIGLDAIWLRALLTRTPKPKNHGLPWMLTGLVGGAAMSLVDHYVLFPSLPPAQVPLPPSPWIGLLASTYGAVAEEVFARFGIATLLSLLLLRVFNRTIALSIAVVLSALIFGALHLPTASAIWPLVPAVIVRTLALSGILGLMFGVAYIKHGLEAAILCHLGADITLHVIAPVLLL